MYSCIVYPAGPSPGLVQSPGADRVHRPGQIFTHPSLDSNFINHHCTVNDILLSISKCRYFDALFSFTTVLAKIEK